MVTIGARKTSVIRLTPAVAQDFLQKNHRSGELKSLSATRNIGLFFAGDLIAVAQFGFPRTKLMSETYTTELYRLAFKENYRIPGGIAKLIKHYTREYNPSDFFTYQDTSGEATAAYEHAGMTLVSQAKKKQYLVAPGKTRETGSRKEVLGMPYATRYGPDRILGTKLGEVFREDGSRKSNKDIFLEDLGWHIEETSGDRVYEWVDPNRTYYTYKITASDSDKYYYGVSHVKKANATAEDCLNDGYFGSGGNKKNNKFRSWKSKHKKFLQKEILATYFRKGKAFNAEATLVGELWRTDPLCLNSTLGGSSGGMENHGETITTAPCEVHGATKHLGAKCFKCFISSRYNLSHCEVHGESLFSGNSCVSCSNGSIISMESCEIHGVSTHQNGVCYSCRHEGLYNDSICPIHGENLHRGGACVSCSVEKRVTLKLCPVHGESKHNGDQCYKCYTEKMYVEKNCPTHGVALHRGNSCQLCVAQSRIHKGNCKVHGETTFSGKTCTKCENQKRVALKLCSIHGETKHQGNTCSSCANGSLISMRKCSVHGTTKHRGNSCYKCASQKRKDRISSVQ